MSTPLEEFFADLQAEYDALGPAPKPTLRSKARAAIIDARSWLARRIDPDA